MLALVALLAPAAAQARPAASLAQDGCANANLLPTRANLELVRDAVLCLHNRERARHGLPRLRESPKLSHAAERHTTNMIGQRYFDHTSPSGTTMVARIRKTGYTRDARAWALGENIAWGSGGLATAAQIQRGWMNSPGHRTNVLQRSFREIGIGIAAGLPVRLSAAQAGATYTTDFGFRR